MAAGKRNDSHVSQPAGDHVDGPTRQHFQMAEGKPLDGEKEPYAKVDTTKKINQKVTW